MPNRTILRSAGLARSGRPRHHLGTPRREYEDLKGDTLLAHLFKHVGDPDEAQVWGQIMSTPLPSGMSALRGHARLLQLGPELSEYFEQVAAAVAGTGLDVEAAALALMRMDAVQEACDRVGRLSPSRLHVLRSLPAGASPSVADLVEPGTRHTWHASLPLSASLERLIVRLCLQTHGQLARTLASVVPQEVQDAAVRLRGRVQDEGLWDYLTARSSAVAAARGHLEAALSANPGLDAAYLRASHEQAAQAAERPRHTVGRTRHGGRKESYLSDSGVLVVLHAQETGRPYRQATAYVPHPNIDLALRLRLVESEQVLRQVGHASKELAKLRKQGLDGLWSEQHWGP